MSTIYRTFWYRTSRWFMLYKEKYCTMILSVLMHFDIQKSILIRYQSISSQIQLLLTSRARYSTLLRNIIVQYIDGGLKAVNIIVELFEVFFIIELMLKAGLERFFFGNLDGPVVECHSGFWLATRALPHWEWIWVNTLCLIDRMSMSHNVRGFTYAVQLFLLIRCLIIS